MENELDQLKIGASKLGVSLTDTQVTSLLKYLQVLEETNRSFNLTRISRSLYVPLHLLDSLATIRVIPTTECSRILDIGTGAGFPGVPLAAALPESHVTLLDSTLKKVRFAAETAKLCGITNCTGLHQRAESLAKDPHHRSHYDLVVSRAVASFDTLIGLMLPFVKSGGYAVALKGAKASEELHGTAALIRKLGGNSLEIIPVEIPGVSVERYLVTVKKN